MMFKVPNSVFIVVLIALLLLGCSDSGTGPTADGDKPLSDGDGEAEVDMDADGDPDADREAPRQVRYTEEREPCIAYNPERNLYFGDLHAHSRYSWDAYGYDMRTTLAEAYAFAKGQPVNLPPLLDDNETGTREARIDRPLDFIAMTDHIEYVGEYLLCTDPESEVYDAEECRAFREGGQGNVTRFGIRLASDTPARFESICGADGARCRAAAARAWKMIVQAAEQADDKSAACGFTAFVGYEYTGTPSVVNYHRNVLFRNASVPENPTSYYEKSTPVELWSALKSSCQDGLPGCESMVIPHNSNWSNGNMFTPAFPEGAEKGEKREYLELRKQMEPIVEGTQHKGDQECKNGFEGSDYDPFCDFEKIREDNFTDCGGTPGAGGANGFGCISKLDYIRNVYSYGLVLKREYGINPYKFGVFGSTDTHNGTPGNVAEKAFPGHVGLVDDTIDKRLGPGTMTHQPKSYNPGGLAAVWAHENSRDAIWQAFQRGEIYASSGPRIRVRFFGGWSYPDWLCDEPDFVSQGYRDGVPMGGDLPARPNEQALPVFALKAHMDAGDAGDAGIRLQVAQIIKGWIDENGQTHERVFDVAGNALNGASVDEASCEVGGEGAESLCAVWVDESFEPGQNAYYYARVIQNPSCRWVGYDCAAHSPGERPDECANGTIKKSHQERAWTTPIWYEP